MRRATFVEQDRRNAECPCGSGQPWAKCNPAAGLVACVDCGRPFHPASNASLRCGNAKTGEGCAGARRRELEAQRKRDARANAAATGSPLR